MDQLNPIIQPLVMNTERGRSFMAVWNAELEEAMDTDAPASDNTTTATTATTATTTITDVPAPPTPDAAAAAAAAAAAPAEEEAMIVEEVAVESPMPGGRRMLERLRQEVAHRSAKEEPEPNMDVVLGSESWHDEVPRVSIPIH